MHWSLTFIFSNLDTSDVTDERLRLLHQSHARAARRHERARVALGDVHIAALLRELSFMRQVHRAQECGQHRDVEQLRRC